VINSPEVVGVCDSLTLTGFAGFRQGLACEIEITLLRPIELFLRGWCGSAGAAVRVFVGLKQSPKPGQAALSSQELQ